MYKRNKSFYQSICLKSRYWTINAYTRIYNLGAAVFRTTKGFHGWKTWGIYTYHWVFFFFFFWLHKIEYFSLVLSLSSLYTKTSVLWCYYYSNLALCNLMHHIWQYLFIYIEKSSSEAYQHIKHPSVFDIWKKVIWV